MCEEGTVRKKEQVEQIPVDSLGKADKCQVATNNRKAVWEIQLKQATNNRTVVLRNTIETKNLELAKDRKDMGVVEWSWQVVGQKALEKWTTKWNKIELIKMCGKLNKDKNIGI